MNMHSYTRSKLRVERINAAVSRLDRMTPMSPVRVRTDERRAYLLSHTDDLVFYEGRGFRVRWKNLQGGVWEAFLKEETFSEKKTKGNEREDL